MRQQVLSNGAEVRVVRSHHDGHAKLRRLQRVVSARRNKAAAHKRDRGKRVDRGQLADGVEKNNLAGSQLVRSSLPPANANPDRRTQGMPDRSSSAATAANRSGCRGASTIASCGSAASNCGHASSRAASSPSSVLPATTNRRPGAMAFSMRVASASCGGADIELQISGDRDALRRTADRDQPIGVGLALRQHATKSAQESAATAPSDADSAARSGPRCAH